ncbi:MAG TPA: OPT/YSL family transporter, partial [Chitinophagaceae bacterium]|nr:OPT/YSL family transporter [Chitinophagaceae bacterium]
WQFVLVGVFIAVTLELCGIKSLSFAVGTYLPLSTTLPIFIGGAIRGLIEWRNQKSGVVIAPEEEDLGRGNLFATGLVAGGALAGVIVAFLSANEDINQGLQKINTEPGLAAALGEHGYDLLGVLFFAIMCFMLYRTGSKRAM